MSRFQILTLAGFVICIIIGVIAFATFKGSSGTATLPPITVWGTFPADTFNLYVSKINQGLQQAVTVKYVQKKPDQFSPDFIAALARGAGPDAILIPSEMILPHEDKLALIPYSAFPQRTYLNTYIQEADTYISANGILALPFTVDPLIMYWNRDMFNSAGVATYPSYWDEFTGLNQKLTVKDQNGNVRKSAVALGDMSNATNGRELLGTLIMQLGNPVTALSTDGYVQSTVKLSATPSPLSAIQFYTQFVDPTNANYSWNRGMPNDKSAFLSGVLATYFGFASELKDIRAKNPNLNFDAAPLPQARTGGVKAAYGRMFGFSIVKTTPDPNSAYQIISILLQPQYLSDLSNTMYLPPVRRDLIAKGSADPYMTVFDQAALNAKSWLDADPAKSKKIFADMVQSISSGQKTVYTAIQDEADQYDVVLKSAMQ